MRALEIASQNNLLTIAFSPFGNGVFANDEEFYYQKF